MCFYTICFVIYIALYLALTLTIFPFSGSGKTTLLDVISGRQQPSNGIVKLNKLPFSKDQRRRLAYVQQDETFFSQLTLWETLWVSFLI